MHSSFDLFMKPIFVLLLSLIVSGKAYPQSDSTKLSNRYWYLIQAPHAPQDWNAWRNGLTQWKDSLMHMIHYDEKYYNDPKYQWASKAYSTFYLMANDRNLYDSSWNYDIKKCLGRYEKEFGGVDIVLLWATYPQLGFDNRDQYSFYRNLPGGIPALKKLSNEIHAMGKKFCPSSSAASTPAP